MKASGGLTYVTGPMGSGKSLFGTRKLTDAIMSGRYVVTNVALREGWAERMARHTPQCWVNPFSYRKRVRMYESLYVFTPSLEQATAFRVPGKKESRAVFVWDEAHNDMNNREWMAENNKYVIKWATQLRKLGFAGYLLSQHRDNTDAALRRIANFEVRLRNQREAIRVLGMKVSPIPFFLAIWYPANMPKVTRGDQIIHIERYFLSWHKKLYDTLGLYHNLDEDIADLYENVILLPKPGTWHRSMIEGVAADLERSGVASHAEAMALAEVSVNRSLREIGPPISDEELTVVPGPQYPGASWRDVGLQPSDSSSRMGVQTDPAERPEERSA